MPAAAPSQSYATRRSALIPFAGRPWQMFYLRVSLLLFTLLGTLATQTQAHLVEGNQENWLQLTDTTTKVTTADALYVLQDPLSQLSLSYIQNNDLLFSSYPKRVFNEGFTQSGYWLKFHVRNDAQHHHKWLMEIGYPLLDRLNIFVEDDQGNRLNLWQLGDLKPFTERPIEHRNFVVPLDFSEHPIQTVFINVQSSSSVQLPIHLWQSEYFIEQHSNEQYSLGIYYGMMAVMFLYNLFLWVSIRDKSYLLYIGYIASFAALQLATSGIGYQFIWGSSPTLAQLAVPLTIALVGVFGTAFTRSFLHTQTTSRNADRALVACMAMSGFTGLLAFFSTTATVMTLAAPVVLAFLLVILYASLSTLLRGHREARYFLAAWVAFIIGGLVTIVTIFGFLPNNVWTIHASKIGSVFEIVLLSFALADRINILQAEKKAAEQRIKVELEQKAESLMESNRLKNDFLATISHEFRTPLNGILGSLELAADENDGNAVSSLKDARTSANEMLELVDNVLTYTELQSGTRVVSPENVELIPALEYFANSVRPLCAAKNLKFELVLEANLPQRIYIDIKCVRHALKALIDNAIKFTESGHIRLTLSMSEMNRCDCLDIQIQDTGIGMTATELERVTGFMSQGDSSYQRRYQGLGIGLSLVRAVCHCLQGNIHISSHKGEGSTVRLRLPARAASPQQRPKMIPLADSHSISGQSVGRVLVVEDNTINQKVLKSMLSRLQLQADIADNGEKALEMLNQTRDYRYDLIFMDCQMPVMDGFEATQHIRDSQLPEADTPIVAVTANAMSGDEKLCLDAGMNDYLSKPINMDQVRVMVSKWLVKQSDETPTANQAKA